VVQPVLDARLEAYRMNARLVPEIAGLVVPEPVSSEGEYRERILEPLYGALEPHDSEGVLRHEWANARGAIARFERGAIEVRVIDTQECPTADMALVSLLVATVRALTEQRWAPSSALDAIETEPLAALLGQTTRVGPEAKVELGRLLSALGVRGSEASAGRVWQLLADRLAPDHVPAGYGPTLERIVAHGPLAARMLRASQGGASIRAITRSLSRCLAEDRFFLE
jgi:carboxylate-amine ligase